MKIIKRMIAIVMVVAVCLTTLTTTAFAWGKDLVELSDDERFEALWEELTQHYMGLDASLMHDELKKFVSELKISTVFGYDVDDGYNDFKEWYFKKHEGMKINTYNKDVINYIKEHPNAELTWSGTMSEYSVSDKNVLVYKGSRSIDSPYMQYDPKNMNNLIIWTYDPDKEQFIGKDESGKLVKKVTAYSKPYGYSETTDTSKPSEASIEDTVSSYPETEAENSTPITESDIGIAVDEPSESVERSVNDEAVEESPVEEKTSSDDGSTTIIIIVCGIIVAGVFAFLIMKKKKV